MFIARAVCGVTHVTVAALFCSSNLLCISKCDWGTENEAGRSVSVSGNEEPAGEICHQYSSAVTAIIPYLHTIKLQYTLLGDYWVCVQPAWLPHLNLSSELHNRITKRINILRNDNSKMCLYNTKHEKFIFRNTGTIIKFMTIRTIFFLTILTHLDYFNF